MRTRTPSLPLLAVLVLAPATLTLGGCALGGGNAEWRGEAAEKNYDRDQQVSRLADANYDDYYQFVSPDNRLYVLTSETDYIGYRTTGEVPFNVKRINGGPNGQTAVYGLVKDETKALELDPNFQGAGQRMYEGTRVGSPKKFYGQVQDGGTIYVFNNWADLAAYRQGRGTPTGFVVPNATPEGATVVYVNQPSLPADASARFARLHAQPMRPMKTDVEVQEVDMSDFVLPPENK